jgi:N-acetylmuramoyl-L-alanine amidase
MNRVMEIARLLAMNSLAIGGLALFVAAAVQLSRDPELAGFGALKVPKFVREVPAAMLMRAETDEMQEPARAVAQVTKAAPLAEIALPPLAHDAGDPRPVVVLDPGHGGRDGGTIAGGALEKKLNLDAAKRVAKRLQRAGVKVVYTRADDSYISLAGRAMIANRYPSALFVSIHHNASTIAQPSGVETYYTVAKSGAAQSVQRRLFKAKLGERFIDRRGELLAIEIQDAFTLATGAVDRGIKNHTLVVTRMVTCPAVLVECGFLSNTTERKNLQNETYRDKMSAGIAGGVMRYLNEVESQPHFGIAFPSRVAKPAAAATVAESQPENPES